MKKTLESFLNEKMGVPSGIMDLANQCGEQIARKVIENDIFESGKFSVIYRFKEVHPEFPVVAVHIAAQQELKYFMHEDFRAEGSFDPEKTKKGSNIELYIKANISVGSISPLEYMKNRKKFNDALIKEVQTLFFHEILHAYETYKRTQKNELNEMFTIKDFFTSDVATQLQRTLPHLPSSVKKFFFLLYTSAAFEGRARTSQVYPLIKDIPNAHDREKVIVNTNEWMIANALTSFSGEEFYNTLKTITGDDHEQIQNFVNSLRNQIWDRGMHVIDSINTKLEKIGIESPNEKTAYIEKQIHSGMHQIASLSSSPRIFFKQWEKKFHFEGKKCKRKLSKLATI